ncbi:hypothetical protein [Methylobacterium sp. Leaf87]|uniref:hypothetical protein n=1 Tax=Methylobacterium sp. Leaf87 TaxID=1736243 RepID=UPI000A90FB41|nr:hypothetical protein [Methylobacterium sp. Leaf87]
MKEQPWHAKAREMLAAGATHTVTSAACGISTTTLARFTSPAYRAAQQKKSVERNRERYATDPEFRARALETNRERRRRWRLRKDAKCEAYDSGRRYEDVCAAWDITP